MRVDVRGGDALHCLSVRLRDVSAICRKMRLDNIGRTIDDDNTKMRVKFAEPIDLFLVEGPGAEAPSILDAREKDGGDLGRELRCELQQPF